MVPVRCMTAAITLACLFVEMLCYVLERLHYSCVLKGQLKSKAIHGILDSPKKNERKRFDLMYHSSNKSIFFLFFIGFFGEVRKTKIAFKIIWSP